MQPRTLVLLCAGALQLSAQSPPQLDFLTDQVDGRGLREMLPAYLRQQVRARRHAPASAATFRARFIELLGGLPDRTPLNARTVGVVEREGYRIEKVIFESQRGFYVTANLYLPKSGSAPHPAILFPLGHETGAKAYPVWQQILGTFARNGYVALAWDTLGQGERIQHYDEAFGDSKVAPSTTEHTELGIQCLLNGDAIARYTVWDGIRALDYLVSRPEVDPERVGVTGNSGGGTHTAYLSSLDPRLKAAAPSCFLTTWERLLETIGPQDGEQCIPGFLGAGFDHADFVRAFAPKPYLMLSAIRDFFSIRGARTTFAAGRDIYAAAGAPDSFSMAEADEGHGYSKDLRRASYPFFARSLKGPAFPAEEVPVSPAGESELWCTNTGQVATSLGGKTVFTLNRERSRELAPRQKPSQADVRNLIGWRETSGVPAAQKYGSEQYGGLTIQKLVYESEPGITVPAVIVSQPAAAQPRPAVLLVSAQGKIGAWKEIERLASSGATVMAIDARGLGETRLATSPVDDWLARFGDYSSAETAVLLGESLAGMRARDIQRGYDLLVTLPNVDRSRVFGAGQGNAAVALLHAAAAGTHFKGLLLDGMLASYRSVVDSPVHRGIFEAVVPGALRHYDLPDLASLAAPGAVMVVDATTPLGAPLELDAARKEYARAANASVVRRALDEPAEKVYTRLLN